MESSIKTEAKLIEERAADWIIRRDSEEWSAADQAELEQWLMASTANKVAFIRLEAGWNKAHRLKALAGGMPEGLVPPPGQWRLSPFFDGPPLKDSASQREAAFATRIRQVRIAAMTAGILGAALLTGWYLWPEGTAYRTEVGGIQAVPMSDGSRITLNTDSKIRVDVSDSERRVNLEQGEAFFEVAKDPRRPFVVKAGQREVIAVGTAFSVRRDGDDVAVVVTEGAVRLDGVAASSESNQIKNEGELLSAGAVARSTVRGTRVEKKPLDQAQEQLSWRTGLLVFHETALVDAIAEFNRYNTRKMVIEDSASMDSVHVGGTFRSTNVDAFVRFLEQGFEMEATHGDDEIRLRKR